MSQADDSQICRWHAVANVAALHDAVAARVLAAAARSIAARGRFLVVLAGGETPRGAYELLCAAPEQWALWHVYFGDERCTPVDDALRNSRMAASALLEHVAIPEAQVHVIPAELGPDEAARRYAGVLEPIGEFDLVLLGLGEDGHTGSLFAGHDLGCGPGAPGVLAVFDAPKPPPDRVTLSAPRFSRTAEAVFMVAGAAKRDAVQRWRAGAAIPARAIAPKSGVDVFLEAALLEPLPR
jgi:6-phosphogluconolactonase